MSPYHHRFNTFRTIDPQPINAVDKTVFKAIAVSDMTVAIPNGTNTKCITLKDVWYCPELAFILVSIGHWDVEGYSAPFKEHKCTICDPHGILVGLNCFQMGCTRSSTKLNPKRCQEQVF